MTDSQKNLALRWFDEIWNQGRREAIAEMLAPDAIIHDGDHFSRGPEGFYAFFDTIHGSFSDMRLTVEDIFGEGDKICIRWSTTGTHTGGALGMEPTGNSMTITGISIARIANGKFVEAWQTWDKLGMMEQIKGTQTAAAVHLAGR
jgi:predicted ester cyclase